jgi:hypothetical protein
MCRKEPATNGANMTTIVFKVDPWHIVDSDIEVSGCLDIEVNGAHIGQYELDHGDVEVEIKDAQAGFDIEEVVEAIFDHGAANEAVRLLVARGAKIEASADDREMLLVLGKLRLDALQAASDGFFAIREVAKKNERLINDVFFPGQATLE